MAQTLNIVPTKYEIQQAELVQFGPKLSSQLNQPSWISLVSYDWALQQNINLVNLSQYQGYSLIFWFGQHLETGPQGYTSPNFGNPQLVSKDQSYAQSRANYYYQQLNSKKMSIGSVYKAVQSDKKLSFVLLNNKYLSLSTQFGSKAGVLWSNQVGLSDVTNYIASQANPGLSQVRTGKIPIVNNPVAPKDYANGYFYIVELDMAKRISNITSKSFSKDVNNEPSKYIGW
jgi:hypothetical protein